MRLRGRGCCQLIYGTSKASDKVNIIDGYCRLYGSFAFTDSRVEMLAIKMCQKYMGDLSGRECALFKCMIIDTVANFSGIAI